MKTVLSESVCKAKAESMFLGLYNNTMRDKNNLETMSLISRTKSKSISWIQALRRDLQKDGLGIVL